MKQEPKVENLEPTSKIRVLVWPGDESIVAARMARREALVDGQLVTAVQAIFARVKEHGDRAVLAATTTHDGVELSSSRVPESEIERAVDELPPELRAAIDLARGRIERVNRELVPRDVLREMEPGIRVGELYRPLESVALWIPCRKEPLLSTALMLVTAASVARVPRIVVLMPPRADGSADPGTLAAARLAGAGDCFVGNGVALLAAAWLWELGPLTARCWPMTPPTHASSPGTWRAKRSTVRIRLPCSQLPRKRLHARWPQSSSASSRAQKRPDARTCARCLAMPVAACWS
jgi:hypothetical protein